MTDRDRAFPNIVIDLGPSAQRTGPPPASPLAQTVQGALREVLAWRPKAEDAKGFVAALNQAFTVKDVDGHTEWKWTPRSYAIQADMGAVTGAQASIYSRAKAALDQSIPLLEGLRPLRPDADTQDSEGVRAIVSDRFRELVGELGVVGGPRIPRVDLLFNGLLGIPARADESPEHVLGLLGDLREEFGLQRAHVNTIDEEQNLTNYLIVVEHVISLHRSWERQRHYFDTRGHDVFLGTQLVQLSRTLGVVGESIQELRFIMDSVWLGAAERQTVRLSSHLTIAELLDWVERFAVEEAPRLIRDGGRDGVIALRSTLSELVKLIAEALAQSRRDDGNPQAGFHSDRVRIGLDELHRHLRSAQHLTNQLRRGAPPRIIMLIPDQVPAELRRIAIEGHNLSDARRVYLNPWGSATRQPIEGQSIVGERVSILSNELRATFDLSHADPWSQWAVLVEASDGAIGISPEPLTVIGGSEGFEGRGGPSGPDSAREFTVGVSIIEALLEREPEATGEPSAHEAPDHSADTAEGTNEALRRSRGRRPKGD